MLWLLALVACASVADLLWPRRETFTDFDGAVMGRLDADMWRSYYERRPVSLFRQLARAHRVQFHTGYARSYLVAFRAGRAAFTFKDGRSRADYGEALPDLEQYFASINDIAARPFDVPRAAREELEWWIVRREPARHTTADWERYIAGVASNIYHVPPGAVAEYARLRVEAMVLRDRRGESIGAADWEAIQDLLVRGWTALSTGVRSR